MNSWSEWFLARKFIDEFVSALLVAQKMEGTKFNMEPTKPNATKPMQTTTNKSNHTQTNSNPCNTSAKWMQHPCKPMQTSAEPMQPMQTNAKPMQSIRTKPSERNPECAGAALSERVTRVNTCGFHFSQFAYVRNTTPLTPSPENISAGHLFFVKIGSLWELWIRRYRQIAQNCSPDPWRLVPGPKTQNSKMEINK